MADTTPDAAEQPDIQHFDSTSLKTLPDGTRVLSNTVEGDEKIETIQDAPALLNSEAGPAGAAEGESTVTADTAPDTAGQGASGSQSSAPKESGGTGGTGGNVVDPTTQTQSSASTSGSGKSSGSGTTSSTGKTDTPTS
jgi:hypothetical protein